MFADDVASKTVRGYVKCAVLRSLPRYIKAECRFILEKVHTMFGPIVGPVWVSSEMQSDTL